MWKLRRTQSCECKGKCFTLLPWPPENAVCYFIPAQESINRQGSRMEDMFEFMFSLIQDYIGCV